MESDNELNTFSEEDNSELSEQSGGSESESELYEQLDREENDSESEEDIKYMKGFGDIKFVGDKIYEQADSKLNLDNDNVEINGDVYKLCGYAYKRGEHTVYFIKGMLFVECDDIGTDEDTWTDEIMNWDGKCFKRLKLAWDEKLERDNQELEIDKH